MMYIKKLVSDEGTAPTSVHRLTTVSIDWQTGTATSTVACYVTEADRCPLLYRCYPVPMESCSSAEAVYAALIALPDFEGGELIGNQN